MPEAALSVCCAVCCSPAICSVECANNGTCVRPDTCECRPMWQGHDCSIRELYWTPCMFAAQLPPSPSPPPPPQLCAPNHAPMEVRVSFQITATALLGGLEAPAMSVSADGQCMCMHTYTMTDVNTPSCLFLLISCVVCHVQLCAHLPV